MNITSLVSKISETEKGKLHFAFPFQVKQNLVAAIPGSQVSFPFFMAFISLLSNIELIKKIYLNATNGSRTIEITKGNSFIYKIIVRFLPAFFQHTQEEITEMDARKSLSNDCSS